MSSCSCFLFLYSSFHTMNKNVFFLQYLISSSKFSQLHYDIRCEHKSCFLNILWSRRYNTNNDLSYWYRFLIYVIIEEITTHVCSSILFDYLLSHKINTSAYLAERKFLQDFEKKDLILHIENLLKDVGTFGCHK